MGSSIISFVTLSSCVYCLLILVISLEWYQQLLNYKQFILQWCQINKGFSMWLLNLSELANKITWNYILPSPENKKNQDILDNVWNRNKIGCTFVQEWLGVLNSNCNNFLSLCLFFTFTTNNQNNDLMS